MSMVDPHNLLRQVEPDLAKVILAASQTPQGFIVVYGIRSLEAEKEAVATHHSTTLHSRHLADKNGLAAAVDVAAWVHGAVSWAAGREAEVFGAIAKQIKEVAEELRVPIEWGGDWSTFKDWGHFQLPWKDYP